VQLLRTYGVKHPPFPFAPGGERSVALAYTKAFALARSLIYIEDQYLWSAEVAEGIASALERNPGLKVIAVVPRYPDSDGPLSGPPKRLAQLRAISRLCQAAPDRVGVFDLENTAGTPIYVHAKICIIDDTWFTCGSDNFNRRSWTTDSELTCAVIDTSAADRDAPAIGTDPGASRPLAYALRHQLWAEHLGLDQNDPQLHAPEDGLKLWNAAADALDHWHEKGRRPPRPTGHVRHHTSKEVPRLQRLWADPANRLLIDPDGRPRQLRGTTRF
jgi:phosphatidylserine/phosphatidylglycerophosphate/cardiolipin synthase-like enzyme